MSRERVASGRTFGLLAAAILVMACFFMAGCGRRSSTVDRVNEDGIEVVLNHIEPYVVHGEPSKLRLEKEFVIDMESREFAEQGLTDIRYMNVDSRGNIYIIQPPRGEAFLVFKFDSTGRLEKRFARRGSGPGEIQWPRVFGIGSHDEILVIDGESGKLLTFAPSGVLMSELSIPKAARRSLAMPLANGDFLASGAWEEGSGAQTETSFGVFDHEFTKIRALSQFKVPPDPEPSERINVFTPFPLPVVTRDRIFLGCPGKTYEIFVYDLEGNLIRKIRKDYRPVPVTEAYQKATLARAPKDSPILQRIYFPPDKPAFQFLFADEADRLFVVTSEVDAESGQDVCDIFDRDGIYIGRAPIGYFDYIAALYESSALSVTAANGRMFVLHEKESGFKELIVYRANWK